MAPSQDIFNEVIKKCQEIMNVWYEQSNDEDLFTEDEEIKDSIIINLTPSLIEYPHEDSIISAFLFTILYPLNLLIHLTIPDVRLYNANDSSKSLVLPVLFVLLACLVWLIVASYIMVISLEILAKKLNVPDAIIGTTVAAAGTSLPNYVASQVAARQGQGNMAIGNAFGSNTFNLTIGLGLPWTLYIIFVNNMQPYHSLCDEGIMSSVVILLIVLFIFVIIIVHSNCVLYRWHGYFFFCLYITYVISVIYKVYKEGMINT